MRVAMSNILGMLLISLSLSLLAETIRSDTLILQDGTRLSGVLGGATAQTFTFKDSKGTVHRYKRTQIQSLKFETTSQKTTTPSVQSKQLETLPNGTEVAVRTNEAIDSKSAEENQAFSAQVDQDVIGSSNNIVVPKGSPAELVFEPFLRAV